MKSKITKIQVLKKGILLILMLAIMMPSAIFATEGLTLQESTALEKLLYGEIGSVVRKIEEHFKSNPTLYITNEIQLRALAEYVNNGNSCYGKYIRLLNDIEVDEDVDWTPIGNFSTQFSGTFIGNGYKIECLVKNQFADSSTLSDWGLFGVIGESGTVSHVTVEAKIEGYEEDDAMAYCYIGSIAGINYGEVNTCYAQGNLISGTTLPDVGEEDNYYIGNLIGQNEGELDFDEETSIDTQTFKFENKRVNVDTKMYIQKAATGEYQEVKDFSNTIYLQNEDKMKIELTLDTYLYVGLEDGNEIKLADKYDEEGELVEKALETIYPKLKIGSIVFTPVQAIASKDSAQTKLVYEAIIANEENKEEKSMFMDLDFTKNMNDENLYVYYSENAETFNTGDLFSTRGAIFGFSIAVDTKLPEVETQAYVEEASESHKYTEKKEIIIKVKSTEKIQDTVAPEIQVSFSKSGLGKYNYQESSKKGNAVHVDSLIDGEGKTTWIYSYIIQNGDEGTLNIEYLSGTIKDLSGNLTDISTLEIVEIEDIYADTTAPTVEIIAKEVQNSSTNKDVITYEFIWSEKVEEFTENNITVNNGIKGTLSALTIKEDGKYVYTIDITSNVASGNVGELQVIIEEGACKDIVGYSNVRTENIIKVDKKAPMLLSLEALATSDIAVNEEIDVIKEYYKAGEIVTIIATLDENISSEEIPVLNLQFSESGNSKNKTTAIIERNKIIYTYQIATGDKGIVSIKSLSGSVTDVAGNETTITRKLLDGNTIIADTIIPNIKELNVATTTGTYNAGKDIRIEAIFDEEVYALENNEIKNITTDSAPTLKYRFGDGEERIASAIGYGTKEDGTEDKTKVIYTCEIEDGDNGLLEIISYSNKEKEENEYIAICDIAANICNLSVNQTGNKITADTIKPQVTNIAANVAYPSVSNTGIYHKEGNTIKITLTFDEKVSSAVLMPEILVGFSEEETEPEVYNTYAYESDWNVNSTTIEYSYTIKNGDNGYLWVKVPENQFRDEAGNKNVSKEAVKLNVYADTTVPTLTLLKDTEVSQANQTITVKATFSEDVYDLNNSSRVTLTNTKAPKLIYSFGTGDNKEVEASRIDGAIITYIISKDPVNDNGTLRYELAKGNLCDRAGNEYYQETTDTTAPILEEVYISSNSEYTYCKAGTEIYVTAVFNEDISSQVMKLKVKIGDEGQEKEVNGVLNTNNKKEIIFTYKVQNGDNGQFNILDIIGNTLEDETLEDNTYGFVRDIYGNQANIFNLNGYTVIGRETADTIIPTLEITADAERTNKDVVTYTFTWSETVTGFTEGDIDLTNGLKQDFQTVINTNGKVYKLIVDVLEEGRQIIKVNSGVCMDLAGNTNVERFTYNKVFIDYTKPVIRAEVNGGNYVIDTDKNKSVLSEVIIVNEELEDFEYVWSTSETLPESGWTKVDVSNIFVDSDVKLKTEVNEEKTYYLYVRAIDLAGNKTEVKTKGFVVAKEDITLTANTTNSTKDDVTVTVVYGDNLTEDQKAGISGKTQSANASKVIVSENGTVYAEATDKNGNRVYKALEITNIDKKAPEAKIEYTTNEDKTVTAKIVLTDENDTIITNNNGEDTYTFTENGEFTFEFRDSVENTGTATAVVTSIEVIEEDKTAPIITFNYTLSAVTVGEPIGVTILTNEEALILYSWDNENWTTSKDYITTKNVTYETTKTGTYTLYAKATDRANNQSTIEKLEFKVVAKAEKVEEAEIIFEDLTTVQVNGTKYVKVSAGTTAETLTEKMNKEALCGQTPEFTNKTQDNTLKTGSLISIDGETKYVVIINGDVNCDGQVSFLGDIVMANNYRIGLNKNLSTIQLLAADINNSGNIEFIPDIVAMNNYRLGRIKSL